MATHPIALYPDPILLRPTKPVERVDDEVRTLIENLVETMVRAPGIGLAANQIGVSRRVCVVDLTAGESLAALHVLVNPEITAAEGREMGEEGCLSFPDVLVEVPRATRIEVQAMDAAGEPFTLEAEGLLARAIQHECEHLDGKVFLQEVSALKRELIKKQIRKRIQAGDWVAAGGS